MKTVHRLLVLSVIIALASCVSTKEFNAVQDDLKETNSKLKEVRMELEAAQTELASTRKLLEGKNKNLNKQLEEALYNLNVQMQKVSSLERQLADSQRQLEALSAGSSEEIEKLLAELQTTRENLNTREDKLREAENELEERNQRLIELQNILARKDQAVKDLKNKVMDALVGFNNKGLTVHEKNGKVYVSLDEKLLFQSGQWKVDPRGQQAIRQLAEVLAENPDINIMVEGHTDNVPMSGSGAVKDNWDLSVMRATAVTNILTQNGSIDPSRVIAAGRGEFVPISSNETSEGRQMNRRTEIILTPKLDELLEILESN